MKKSLMILLVFAMLLSLCACGGGGSQTTEPSSAEQVTTNGTATTTGSTESPTGGTEGTTEATQAATDAPTTAPTDTPTVAPTEVPTTPPATQPAACNHSWKNATCTAPKTCNTCGATEGSAAGHSWKNATCTAPKTCKTCGATEGSAAGHSWKNATCTTPKTCKTCGATEGGAAGHSWKNATCTAPKICNTCGATEGSATGHDYENGTCSTCGGNDPTYGANWKLDNGVLTIYGKGPMEDYTLSGSKAPWYDQRESIKTIIVEGGITSIGELTFIGCKNAQNVKIANTVTSIGVRAFHSCSRLTSLSIPESVTNIGERAFYGCSNLTEVLIPQSVISIGEGAFASCDSLSKINVAGTNPSYRSDDQGVLYNKNMTELIAAPNAVTSVEIPSSVTIIGQNAFCGGLTELLIPDSVTSIRAGAFSLCFELRYVYYGGSEDQWNKVIVAERNKYLTYAIFYYNCTVDMIPQIEKERVLRTAADGLLSLIRFDIETFETVDDIAPENLRKAIYREAPREYVESSEHDGRVSIYKVSDLNRICLKFYDLTYDWTQLNDRENVHYYDAATQTVVVMYPYMNFSVEGSYDLVSIEQTVGNMYVATYEYSDSVLGNAVYYLTMKQTQNGYAVVSFTKKG